MSNHRKLLPVTLALSVALSGCFKEEKPKQVEKPIVDRVVTIEDLKSSYGYTRKAIMPMYNIAKNEELVIPFQSYLGKESPKDVISVHTDASLSSDSIIEADISSDSLDLGQSTFTVKPLRGVINGLKGTWGSAPIYYLAINYDLDENKPTRLDRPVVIPFTVKSVASAPELSTVVDGKGIVSLKWSKVKGATAYKVYNLSRPTKQAEQLGLTAQQTGFSGVDSFLLGTTKGNTFTDFNTDGKNGLFRDSYKKLVGQNKGFSGDYYVTAVVNGKETSASNIISSVSFSEILPLQLDEDINGNEYELVRSLPKSVKTVNLKGDVVDTDVTYKLAKSKITDGQRLTLAYGVDGTVFEGRVTLLSANKADLDKLKLSQDSRLKSSYKKVVNLTDMSPSPKVITTPKQLIANTPASTEKGYDEKASSVTDKKSPSGDFSNTQPTKKPSDGTKLAKIDTNVGKQKLVTENIVKQADMVTVTYPAFLEKYKLKLDAGNAVEEYLGVSLLNGETAIDMTAFPEAQDRPSLTSVIDAVILQNPLTFGVSSWDYDYTTRKINVKYSIPPELRKRQQLTLVEKASAVAKPITKKHGSNNADIYKAVYDYLVSSTEYGIPDGEKIDTVYHVLVGKKGKDVGFAQGYKLVLDMLDLQSIVVSGTFKGEPHVWNKVYSKEGWGTVDVMYNEMTTGVPYPFYNQGDSVAKDLGLVDSGNYLLSYLKDQSLGDTSAYEYHMANGWVVDTVEDYEEILRTQLSKNSTKTVVRSSVRLPEQYLYDVTGGALQQYAPDKLATTTFELWGNYIVVKTDGAVIEKDK